MDVMGLIGTATGVVSLAILVAQEARHFGDMPALKVGGQQLSAQTQHH